MVKVGVGLNIGCWLLDCSLRYQFCVLGNSKVHQMLVLTWYRTGLKTCLFYGFFF